MKKSRKGLTVREIFELTLEEHFIDEVGTGCWRLKTKLQARGYHRISIGDSKSKSATRVLVALELGIDDPEDLYNLDDYEQQWGHYCHNKKCINPQHGRVVTIKENRNDSDKPYNIYRGENDDNLILIFSPRGDAAGKYHPHTYCRASNCKLDKCISGNRKAAKTDRYKGLQWSMYKS